MSENLRVHQLAKKLNVNSKELITILKDEGFEAGSHMSIVEDDVAEIIIDHFKETDANICEEESEDQPKESKLTPEDKPLDKIIVSPEEEDRSKENPPIIHKGNELHLKPPIIVKNLAAALNIKPNELIHDLLKQNIFASINQTIDIDVAEKICSKRNFILIAEKREKQATGPASESTEISPEELTYDDEFIETRPPVVAFLGHVDHGKTSLLDKIRKTKVTEKEAGGITQHIGASSIEWKGDAITFIDTPGHEAFTAMRSRGANTTDIVILVVAVDDGIMPQTIEAIKHAKAAKVPIIVAINKIDLPSVDSLKILTELQRYELAGEDWGGETGIVEVSAHTGQGIDELIERIHLEAELLELKANPKLPVKAIVLESQLEQGLGPTVNILIKNGTINVGDSVICGKCYGKVKALLDNHGKRMKNCGPSFAAKVVGLSGVPDSGTIMAGCKNEKQAKKLTEARGTLSREDDLQPKRQANLEDLYKQIEENARKELNVIVKTDAQGTSEAVVEIMKKLESPKIQIKIIHAGVGSISEKDVLLASASDAIVVGFHVRVNAGVNALAKKEGVQIQLYSIIYELAERMKEALTGMLDPEFKEVPLGKAEILQVFSMSKSVNKICGCKVNKGIVKVGAKARVYRGNELIYNGVIQSLRRFQDDVKEVKSGFECGIRLDHFNEFDVGDLIDIYEFVEITPTL